MGVVALFLLPYKDVQKNAYFDENALMPGSLRNHFVAEHIDVMNAFEGPLNDIVKMNMSRYEITL